MIRFRPEACDACRAMPGGGPSDCEGCDNHRPQSRIRNLPVIWVYDRLAAALIDGMGGVNLPGIEAGFRILQVPARARPEILQKLLILAGEIRKKDVPDG